MQEYSARIVLKPVQMWVSSQFNSLVIIVVNCVFDKNQAAFHKKQHKVSLVKNSLFSYDDVLIKQNIGRAFVAMQRNEKGG